MKIDERVSTYMALLHGEAATPIPRNGDESGAAAMPESAPVAVALSPEAVQLADDEARRERLNIIRRQLAEGSYNISGKDVADKILNVLKG